MRSRKKKAFSALRKCSKFKITNWSKYNDILRNRGRVDFMIAENLSDGWYEDNSGQQFEIWPAIPNMTGKLVTAGG